MNTRLMGAVVAASLLSACAVTLPPAQPAAVPSTWYAPPLPHGGAAQNLARWWERFNDPVLSDWIARAQKHSPSIAAARAQVFAARATRLGTESAAGPQAAAVASASRADQGPFSTLGTKLSAGVQASWALDVWGGNAAASLQARAQQDAAGASWHEARVLVASELAQTYFGYRLCREQLAVSERDRDSRAATAQAAVDTERAGLTAPAVAALARASSADAANRTRQQSDQCERQVKALVTLTDLPEPELRLQLAQAPGLPADRSLDAMLTVQAVPLDVVRQRPDVARAQSDLVAASEGVGVARATLLPSLSLSGSLLRNRFTTGGNSTSFNTWSIGPLTLSLPLLGRGGLQANADAAGARYEAAGLAYAATLRRAVAEVEQSLVALAGLQQRSVDSQTAAAGYGQSLTATEARYRAGLANLNELEEARRLQLAAQSAAVALQQERINAWINLYVAVGGGFDPQNTDLALREPS